MNRSAQSRKNAIRWAVVVVLVIDAALLVVSLRPAVPLQALQQQERRLQLNRDLLAADVKRVTAIRDNLSQVQREFDQFFVKELRDTSSGYSSVVADLGQLARTAGLRTGPITFLQHDVGKRGVVEVEITASVEGAYPGLVSFINGLERSENFYVLDSLSLASTTGGSLTLNLKLRTYFRS